MAAVKVAGGDHGGHEDGGEDGFWKHLAGRLTDVCQASRRICAEKQMWIVKPIGCHWVFVTLDVCHPFVCLCRVLGRGIKICLVLYQASVMIQMLLLSERR